MHDSNRDRRAMRVFLYSPHDSVPPLKLPWKFPWKLVATPDCVLLIAKDKGTLKDYRKV